MVGFVYERVGFMYEKYLPYEIQLSLCKNTDEMSKYGPDFLYTEHTKTLDYFNISKNHHILPIKWVWMQLFNRIIIYL